jgi:hypothetical protein
VAAILNQSPWITVPEKLAPEDRAPDSIQFNLDGMTDAQILAYAQAAERMGVKVQVFGLTRDNARAFWNWRFLGEAPDLPKTRAMLRRACDARLPARLTLDECEVIAGVLTAAAAEVMAG